MKPQVIGGACSRVTQVLDEALSEGVLNIPPELAAHAARCPRCGPEVKETEQLLSRLRGAVAGLDLRRVPHVVDYVMAHTASEYRENQPRAAITAQPLAAGATSSPARRSGRHDRRAHWRWVAGQLAVAAAVLVLTVSGLTYTALKINQAISGTEPSEVVARLMSPFHNWAEAQFGRNAR